MARGMRYRGLLLPDQDELTKLVGDVQRGVPDAPDTLLLQLRPSLLAFFARWLPREDAEDLTQSALVRITGAFGHIDAANAAPYLVTLARNLLRSARIAAARAARRCAPIELAFDLESPRTPDGDAEYRDLEAAVRQAEPTLPPTLRTTLRGALGDSSPAERAAEESVSQAARRTRMRRVRARLRATLRGYADEARASDRAAPDD
jgi:RNA polymerase sigma factor (sigma-70 family)